jgi:hypothetical protein
LEKTRLIDGKGNVMFNEDDDRSNKGGHSGPSVPKVSVIVDKESSWF